VRKYPCGGNPHDSQDSYIFSGCCFEGEPLKDFEVATFSKEPSHLQRHFNFDTKGEHFRFASGRVRYS
jgi:hypothetical protein